MKATTEPRWVSFLDSRGWRRTGGWPPAKKVLRSRSARTINHMRRRLLAERDRRKHPQRFAAVHTYAIMIGHTKSGGSLLGSLLDSHPRVAFADEHDLLDHVASGFDGEALAYLAARGARREALKGRVTRKMEPYSLAVPGMSQGTSINVEVVGDSTAGITTQRIGADSQILTRLGHVVHPASVRLIHVVRNPFDPIATMISRGHRSPGEAIDRYFANCAILQEMHGSAIASTIHVVRYEEFVADPATRLRQICTHLSLATTDDYLEQCAGAIRNARPRQRDLVKWQEVHISEITDRSNEFDFLGGYTFESQASS